jgi:hypothetical protein
MAEEILAPFPQTPAGRRLFAPTSVHSSRSATPYPGQDPPESPIRRNVALSYNDVADQLADHICKHVGADSELFNAIDDFRRYGKNESQAIMTLCVLPIQENKVTHTALQALNGKMDAIMATLAVHSATLNTVTQISASRPPPVPSKPAGQTGSRTKAPPPPARQLYSAGIKVPAPPAGPAGPPPTKKN